jgi:hypothetical protein
MHDLRHDPKNDTRLSVGERLGWMLLFLSGVILFLFVSAYIIDPHGVRKPTPDMGYVGP